MQIRDCSGQVLERSARRAAWVKIARENLGVAGDHPLVKAMLYWIPDNELATCLEQVELVTAGKGTPVTVKQMTDDMLSVLQKNLKV